MNQPRQTGQWGLPSSSAAAAGKQGNLARQLEIEYKTMKQENAQLKEVITTLKQEIDLYSRVVTRSGGQSAASQPSLQFSVESLLVNPKRRKTVCLGSNIKQ